MVPAAVDLSILVEINEINQQLHAGGALETLGVPAAAVSSPTSKNSYVSTADLSPTLQKKNHRNGLVRVRCNISQYIFTPFPVVCYRSQVCAALFIRER